jgi:uncharacterized protein YeaO (DUF488 family)
MSLAIRVVRLGTARARDEGLRLGTVRRPPRGVRKADYGKRNFYDLWLPELAPSPGLFKSYFAAPMSERRWAAWGKKYRREMGQPGPERLLQLLAQLSRQANFAVGCYCEREERCHRSILRQLLAEHGGKMAK